MTGLDRVSHTGQDFRTRLSHEDLEALASLQYPPLEYFQQLQLRKEMSASSLLVICQADLVTLVTFRRTALPATQGAAAQAALLDRPRRTAKACK